MEACEGRSRRRLGVRSYQSHPIQVIVWVHCRRTFKILASEVLEVGPVGLNYSGSVLHSKTRGAYVCVGLVHRLTPLAKQVHGEIDDLRGSFVGAYKDNQNVSWK